MQFINIVFLLAVFFIYKPLVILSFCFSIYLIASKRLYFKNSIVVYLLLLLFVVISLIQFFFNSYFFNGVYLFNFLALFTFCIVLTDNKFNFNSLLFLVKIVVAINFILTVSFFLPFVKDTFFVHSSGFYRFKGLFFEPSFAAIFSAFSFILLHFYTDTRLLSKWKAMSIISLVATFSGSGIALIIISFIANIIHTLRVKSFIYIVIAFSLIYVLLFVFYPDNLIATRATATLNGTYSQSTLLRFFAPIEFISFVFQERDVLSMLFGVGDPRIFIENFHANLSYFYIYDGSPTYELNNGYAVLFSLFGLVGVIFYCVFILLHWRNKYFVYNTFFIFLPFFSGHFVSIFYLFFLLLYMTLNKRNYSFGAST
jgi:hypothetical protein